MTVNPLVREMADFGLNPSLSSDDTLAANEGEDPIVSEQMERNLIVQCWSCMTHDQH